MTRAFSTIHVFKHQLVAPVHTDFEAYRDVVHVVVGRLKIKEGSNVQQNPSLHARVLLSSGHSNAGNVVVLSLPG